MKTLPADHQKYLDQRPFDFRCHTDIFPPDELHVLEELGNWMEALAVGAIQPITAEHKHFLAVDRDEVKPKTVAERAWLRLKGRREFEAEESPPHEPVENYGIVDWDKDRCWW
jgi:uncharacterized protein YifE (UPF0438 family)